MNKNKLLRSMVDRAVSRMEHHKIFSDPAIAKLGESMIVHKLIARPRLTVEDIVDSVAKEIKAFKRKFRRS